jgi:hypothetical protein
LAPLAHKENSEENSDSDTTYKKQKSNSSTTKTVLKEHPYQVPLSLRKPFKLPFKESTTVITPKSKTTLTPSSPLQEHKLNNNTAEVASFSPTTASKNATNDKSTKKNIADESIKSNLHNSENTRKRYNTIPFKKSIISSHNFQNILDQTTPKVFVSSYLNKTLRPIIGSFKLPLKLELLETLILLQNEALMQPVLDLATINLNLTKILEKKKESTFNLQNDDKIPRSLCIKCKLTSSSSYAKHPDFLNLKDQLQQEVNNSIANGTKIMITWAKINVKLLNIDRCTDILEKSSSNPSTVTCSIPPGGRLQMKNT